MLDVDVCACGYAYLFIYSLLFTSEAWENELFLKYMYIRNKDPYWKSCLKKLSLRSYRNLYPPTQILQIRLAYLELTLWNLASCIFVIWSYIISYIFSVMIDGSQVKSIKCHFIIGHFVHQQMTAAGLGPGACHYVITHRAGQSLVFPSGRHLISGPRPRVVKCRMHVTSFKRSLSPHGTSQNLMRGEEFIHFWFPEILKQKFLQHVLRIQYKVNASTSNNYHRIFDNELKTKLSG